MKVSEHLENARNPLMSYEIVPPPRGRSVQAIIDIVEDLEPFQPAWIDVTSHAAAAYYTEHPDGTIEKKIFKKRPGTMGICGIIQNRFKIDAVAHMLCLGFTKEETEDALIELSYLGVENVIALRGDGPNFKKSVDHSRSVNYFASDLVEQIEEIKRGEFLHEVSGSGPLDFCVGVAGYPEKHFEAPNLKEDIQNLKRKVDNGAEYIVTQMFYDNQKFFKFVEECRAEGITVPIIPGLKILKSARQLQTLPKNFYIDFPDELVDEVQSHPKHAKEIGLNWSMKQCEELLEYGVPCLHFYIMNDTQSVIEVAKRFR